MSSQSKTKTFLIGVTNVIAVFAVLGFLTSSYAEQDVPSSAMKANVVDAVDTAVPSSPKSKLLPASFFQSEDYKRHMLAIVKPESILEHDDRKLGRGRKGKKAKSAKAIIVFEEEESDCIPLTPTVAPTYGKGRGGKRKKNKAKSSKNSRKGKGSTFSPAPVSLLPDCFNILLRFTIVILRSTNIFVMLCSLSSVPPISSML